MNKTIFDLIVIGGGPAGYSSAVRASQLGAKVLLVDKDALGGTCLNRGCVPTKFLWEAQHLHSKIKRAPAYGITAEIKELSFPALMQKKNRAVGLLSKGIGLLLESYNVTVVEGTAVFSGTKTLSVSLKNGGSESYTAENIIIAAGSEPSVIPGYPFDHEKIIDSTDALNLKDLPRTLLVIGGGAIGVEFASIYSSLGAEVSLVEKEAQLLPGEDPEFAQEVRKNLERQGIKVVTGSSTFDEFLKENQIVLIATGRRTSSASLNLDITGVKHGPKNIRVNEYLETSQKGIYSAGDVTGAWLLAYTAQAEGVVAAENALGAKNRVDYSVIPKVVFSNPPAASVGIMSFKIPEYAVSGRFPFTASSRAFIENERTGWVKIMAEKKTGLITGGQVIGARAEEIISGISIAVRKKLTLQDLSREIFFHPSLSETVHGACEDALGKCVDLPKKI